MSEAHVFFLPAFAGVAFAALRSRRKPRVDLTRSINGPSARTPCRGNVMAMRSWRIIFQALHSWLGGVPLQDIDKANSEYAAHDPHQQEGSGPLVRQVPEGFQVEHAQ